MRSSKSGWATITGADKRKQFPVQQATELGRPTEKTVIFPYGLYCDLPDDVLLQCINDGAAISVTVARPSDTNRGEPVMFHPVTGSRVIFRNNGDIDTYASKNVNINTTQANINASDSVNIVAPDTNITGRLTVDGDVEFNGAATSNGKNISDTHTHVGVQTGPSNTGVVT